MLYGFAHDDERRCFEALLGAHGVGPALALAVLSTLSPATLSTAVLEDDVDTLCAVPGVGRKTAARLLIDLKSRLDLPDFSSAAGTGTPDRRVRPVRGPGGPGRARLRTRGDPRRPRGGARGRRGGGAAPSGAARAGGPVTPAARREVLGDDAMAGRPTPTGPGDGTVRAVDPVAAPVEEVEEAGLRPRTLEEFVGQSQLVEHLGIVLQAARRRRQPVDHLLFAGPPGLGKTSLAGIVAAEMGVGFRVTSGPVLVRAGDLAALLTDLQEGDVLFIDEIHRLPRSVEEILYPAMEDAKLDILIGKGPTARSIRLDLPRFTLVGATTRTGLVAGPLRDRFGFVGRLDLYEPDRAAGHRRTVGPDPRRAGGRRGGGPHRRALARHAQDRQPPAAAGARLRGGARRRRGHRPDRRGGAGSVRCRRARVWTRSTGPSSMRCAAGSAGSRWD